MYGWRLYSIGGFSDLEIGYLTEQDATQGAKDRVARVDWPGYYTYADITKAGAVITTIRFVDPNVNNG